MALPVNAPPLNTATQGVLSAIGGINLGNDVYILTHAGAPTGGAGWAGIGTMVIDRTNGTVYQNTGTKASPTWTINAA